MSFELLSSETKYLGRAFAIRRDQVKLPDGRTTDFDIVEHHGSVVLLPINEKGEILFVRQYRHAAAKDLLELPAGTLDKGEEPLACALREIREETGMAAGQMKEIGQFYLAPGYSTELMVVYLATDLRYDPLDPDADEFLQVEAISIKKALRMAENGEMPDAKSLAAFFMARSHLERLLA
jgi:ADP-ribose pyrophosphatase